MRVYVTTIKCRTNRLPVLRFGRDHGSLHASDSNVFVLAGGFSEGVSAPRRITDVAPTLLQHFEADATLEKSVL